MRLVPSTCAWTITVPERHFIAARYEILGDKQSLPVSFYAHDGKHLYSHPLSMIYSSSNTMYFRVVFSNVGKTPLTVSSNFTLFYLYFNTVNYDGKLFLPIVKTSLTAGYVTPVGFGGKAGYAPFTEAARKLIVSSGYVLMTRFRHVDMTFGSSLEDRVTFYELYNNRLRAVFTVSGQGAYPPRLSTTTVVIIMASFLAYANIGFKLDFSFHPSVYAPVVFTNGKFDCAWPNYRSFKQHMHCDLLIHCAGGQDEGAHCPFSSELCQGDVASGTKCYWHGTNNVILSWYDASMKCQLQGGDLATLRLPEEWEAVRTLFRLKGLWAPAFVGLKKVTRELPKMYWSLWQWMDSDMAYGVKIKHIFGKLDSEYSCGYFDPKYVVFEPAYDEYLFSIKCYEKTSVNYICEKDTKNIMVTEPKVPDLTHNLWSGYQVISCPFDHVTFTFLSCEPSIKCGVHQHLITCTTIVLDVEDQTSLQGNEIRAGHDLSSDSPQTQDGLLSDVVTVTVEMFPCGDPTTLPYSLVCDHVAQCPGQDDEIFCKHDKSLKCDELTCDSGQCYLRAQRCDRVNDCTDCSDEANCDMYSYYEEWHYGASNRPPPTVINFDGQGNFSQRPMHESESCPETHFVCTGRSPSHCLPIYLRCNTYYDCLDREDELACDRYACPGFYRCRESKVCVHVVHMCDGWHQCPQRDDELYCGLTCPRGCLCQGFSFVCSSQFRAHEHPNTRYLDAAGSNMKPEDLFRNTYLVWLRLASCGIKTVDHTAWPNVKYLDMSLNDIHFVSMNSFKKDTNLFILLLAGNPLSALVNGSECFAGGFLNYLDLSNTSLRTFGSNSLSCSPHITLLNLSNCPLDEITEEGFKSIPYLKDVDLRGSPVSRFPRDIFKELIELKSVMADNYKLCCKEILPVSFNENFCYVPYDEISSCEDLLRSTFLRGCVWMFAALSVFGNLFSFVFKLISEQKNRRSGFNIFVTNLTVADSLMGVYLAIVGVADEVYRGHYMWNDTAWQTSSACTTAGFLALLSSEMSAFIICLITLDRFIVLTFPFSSVRFEGWSAALTCGLVWTTGLVLASVPFFPQTSEWEFYGQTGICIPLPTTRKRFPGHEYAFGIMIILNFVLCVLIAIGQAFIYRSVQANSMTSDSSKKSKDLTIARRLITVAASDFMCWFPIGLLGILSSNGVPLSSDVSVAMAAFVLPLNSALNPFLYTFNVVTERRRNVREAQLIKLLEARIRSQQDRQQTACRCTRQKTDQA